MLCLPTEFIALMIELQALFSKRVFLHATRMVAGARMAPGRRTVASVLCIMGLSHEHRFHKYHRVLSHARWSPREAAFVLLRLGASRCSSRRSSRTSKMRLACAGDHRAWFKTR